VATAPKSTAKAETAEPDAPTPAKATTSVDTDEAHTDRIAMVSRDKNGDPDQSTDYEIIVPDREKAAAQNRPADNQVADS
jgi:hypothetical protein